MLRPWFLALLLPTAALAEAPAGLADRAWAITDAVLARGIEPPARQQMLLAGLKALFAPDSAMAAPGLAREVSAVSTADQFAALLSRSWPPPRPAMPADQLEAALIRGIFSAVPGTGELLSARELQVSEQFEGNLYVGLQVAVRQDQDADLVAIAEVLAGGPADKAGVHKGDLIAAVDGIDMKGRPMKEVIDRLRGPRGSEVLVRFRRGEEGEFLDRKMIRDILPRKTVQGLRPGPGGGWVVHLEGPDPIGYLKIKDISGSTPTELAAFADQLDSEGIRALVLDLREVSQSSLHPAILLADALLDGGTIGQIRSAESVRVVLAQPDALFPRCPMVVLAGPGMTAEARWVCSALQDNGRASVVGLAGGRSLDVQSAVPLPGGEWSARFVTGRLERTGGIPFPEAVKSDELATLKRPTADPNYAAAVAKTPRVRMVPTVPDPEALPAALEILSRKLKDSGS